MCSKTKSQFSPPHPTLSRPKSANWVTIYTVANPNIWKVSLQKVASARETNNPGISVGDNCECSLLAHGSAGGQKLSGLGWSQMDSFGPGWDPGVFSSRSQAGRAVLPESCFSHGGGRSSGRTWLLNPLQYLAPCHLHGPSAGQRKSCSQVESEWGKATCSPLPQHQSSCARGRGWWTNWRKWFSWAQPLPSSSSPVACLSRTNPAPALFSPLPPPSGTSHHLLSMGETLCFHCSPDLPGSLRTQQLGSSKNTQHNVKQVVLLPGWMPPFGFSLP